MYKWIGLSILACLFLFFGISGCSDTSSEYAAKLTEKLNEELKDPSNGIRKRIENAHVTVKCKSATVSRIAVTTVDGSNNAGRNGSNVSEVEILIDLYWDGFWHKNGYTQFYIKINPRNKHVNSAGIVKTTALVNIEDPNFWYAVGAGIAILL